LTQVTGPLAPTARAVVLNQEGAPLEGASINFHRRAILNALFNIESF